MFLFLTQPLPLPLPPAVLLSLSRILFYVPSSLTTCTPLLSLLSPPCPPLRRTINFPDLNPGRPRRRDHDRDHDRQPPTSSSASIMSHIRATSVSGSTACTDFMRPCLSAWRHIYEGWAPSIQSRYLLRLSLSVTHDVYPTLCCSETYQILSMLTSPGAVVFLFFPLLSSLYISRIILFQSRVYTDVRDGINELSREHTIHRGIIHCFSMYIVTGFSSWKFKIELFRHVRNCSRYFECKYNTFSLARLNSNRLSSSVRLFKSKLRRIQNGYIEPFCILVHKQLLIFSETKR